MKPMKPALPDIFAHGQRLPDGTFLDFVGGDVTPREVSAPLTPSTGTARGAGHTQADMARPRVRRTPSRGPRPHGDA